MSELNLYRIQGEEKARYVEAEDMYTALRLWHEEGLGDVESVHLVLVLREKVESGATKCSHGKAWWDESARARYCPTCEKYIDGRGNPYPPVVSLGQGDGEEEVGDDHR